MGTLKNWFGGVVGAGVGIAFLVVAPVVSVYKGVEEAMKDNPQGVSDWAQFKEGASFGVIEAEQELTPEHAADRVYDLGKGAAEATKDFTNRIGDRLEEDGVTIPDLDVQNCKTGKYYFMNPDCFETPER